MRWMTGMRLAAMAAVVTAAVTSGGCLVKDASTTLCLEPDGSVRWTVLERNIHATGDTPADRQREEDEFLAAVRADQHPNATAFRWLGGTDVRTTVVSDRWPFTVLTEAWFSDIARLLQQILDAVPEVRARSVLAKNGNKTTWTITLDHDPNAEAATPDAPDLDGSLFDDARPVILMRHGQFVDAAGFDIQDDGRVARLKDGSEWDWDKNPHLVLSLTWVATEAVNNAQKQ